MMKSKTSSYGQSILAGDIGGTKTNLAVYRRDWGPGEPVAEATFPSGKYSGLEVMVREFLLQVEEKVDRASFAVAGPVVNGEAKVTNLPWVMDERSLAQSLNLSSVNLLNDALAFAYAVPFLGKDDLYTLERGRPDPGGALAVVAPGTGLGEAYLTWDGPKYLAFPSEGGHADFAPANALEVGLLNYLLDRFDHVSCERVCSGRGLANIYAYLKEAGYAEEPGWLAGELGSAIDPVPLIVKAALDETRPCSLCRATLDIFVSVLGAEAGNMCLKVMATGGVYLAGGIPARILPALDQKEFMNSFRNKGRMSKLMERTPVHVVMNPKAALLGAACHGIGRTCNEQGS